MKITFPHLALLFTLFWMIGYFGCASTTSLPTVSHKYAYEKLEIDNNAIMDVVEPGMSVSVTTNNTVMRCIVNRYEDANALICVDRFNKKEEKIFINDIEEIKVEVKVDESEEIPEKELVTYTNEGDLFKQILVSLIYYPKIVFTPARTESEIVVEKSEEEINLEKFIDRNIDNLLTEAKSSCGEYVYELYALYIAYIETEQSRYIQAYPYIEGTYDELTKDVFCRVIHEDSGILFGFDNLFLSTLNQRIYLSIHPSYSDPYIFITNQCENIAEVMKEKHEENIESFAVNCSDGKKEFQCDFQGNIAYDSRGIPYKKARLTGLSGGLLVYSYAVQPACEGSDNSSIVRRLALLNGCENVGMVQKLKDEGNKETFSVACSNGVKEFQCDFDGDIFIDSNGYPMKKIYGKSYTSEPACWLQ